MAKKKAARPDSQRSLKPKDLPLRGEAAKRLKGGILAPCFRAVIRRGISIRGG